MESDVTRFTIKTMDGERIRFETEDAAAGSTADIAQIGRSAGHLLGAAIDESGARVSVCIPWHAVASILGAT